MVPRYPPTIAVMSCMGPIVVKSISGMPMVLNNRNVNEKRNTVLRSDDTSTAYSFFLIDLNTVKYMRLEIEITGIR